MRLQKALVLFLFAVGGVLLPSFASALPQDAAFAKALLAGSNCQIHADFFGPEFSAAMDRLAVLNPDLAKFTREISYLTPLWLRCDQPTDSTSIHYNGQTRTIHLRQNAENTQRSVAGFFHEFLHFINVEIDFDFHQSVEKDVSPQEILERDAVYACHLAVFPAVLMEMPDADKLLATAQRQCPKARIAPGPQY